MPRDNRIGPGFVSRDHADKKAFFQRPEHAVTERGYVTLGILRDLYKKKSYFKIEDIPFHQARIYLEGSNAPADPWRVSSHT